jgi:glycosyltransferase involved in cell wall biosynthesis
LARLLNVPFVLTPNHHHHWKGWIYRHYLEVYRQADALIAYTQTEKAELVRLGVAPEKVHVLGIALLAEKPDAARFRGAHGIPSDAPVILFLGQKYAYKRFHLLLEAAPIVHARFADAYFVFLGPRTAYSEKIFAGVDDGSHIIERGAVDLLLVRSNYIE